MKNPSEEEIDKLQMRRNQVTGEIEIECFIARMDEYFKVCTTFDPFDVFTIISFLVSTAFSDLLSFISSYYVPTPS